MHKSGNGFKGLVKMDEVDSYVKLSFTLCL